MGSSVEVNSYQLSQALEADEYLRQRLVPIPTKSFYLHLTDLRGALDLYKTSEKINILDYGCGGSPYRSLFPNSKYFRADFTTSDGLDFLLPTDSSIPASDSFFDMVLSTQVLEHVPEPANYVAECFRVLKPGGSLVVTTHGLFEEHGCPYDFQRWTADGLRLLLEKAGFQIKEAKKLTCGPRALCFFVNQWFWQLQAPRSSLFGLVLWGFRSLWRLDKGWLNRRGEEYFKRYGIVDAETPDNKMYVALLIHAERPNL
jgi:SAM-dependent methyltransferase